VTGKCRKNARKRDKERQTTFKVSSAVGAGIAQAINDLSNPLGLTLNQRATDWLLVAGHLKVIGRSNALFTLAGWNELE